MLVILVLFLPFFLLLRPAATAPIPDVLSTYSLIQTISAKTSSSMRSVTNPNVVAMTNGVAQERPQTGQNYALDPFGFLGSSSEQEGAGNSDQQAKQTQTSKATQTTLGSESTTSAKLDTTSNAASSSSAKNNNAGSATSSSKTSVLSTGPAHESSTQTTTSPSSTTFGNTATPTTNSNDNSDSEPSSGSSMNSWKIIGIGVLSFAGIVALVLGTAFQDAIFRAICRPFRHQKDDSNEVLVPDWRLGSWRFDQDEVNTEKSGCEEDEGPRIGEVEKRGLAFPLPPVSPFALRRTPSLNTFAPADAGKAGIGAGTTAVKNTQDKRNSTLPSPTSDMSTPPTPRDQDGRAAIPIPIQSRRPRKRPQSEAYGGME